MSKDAARPPIRSLHLNTERGFRGGEVQSLAIAAHLLDWGHPVTVMAPPGSVLLRRCGDLGIAARAWRSLGEWDPAAVGALRRAIAAENPAVIHAHTAHALSLALWARGLRKGPPVVAARRVSFPLRSRFSRFKYRRADAVVAVCGSVRESLLASGLDGPRVRVIHSGVDLSRFEHLPTREEARQALGVPDDCPLLGVVSALSHHKGWGPFVTALHQAWMRIPSLRALAVGEGPLLGAIRDACARQNLPIRFLGFVPEPARILPALDLLVLPSLSGEGSPGAIKEAAAAGVPVVATDVGGTAEILRPEVEAVIVPPGDGPALAAGILRILENPPLASRLAQAARQRVLEFSTASTAASTLALYQELLTRA